MFGLHSFLAFTETNPARCPRRESNSHALSVRNILSVLGLPFPHSGVVVKPGFEPGKCTGAASYSVGAFVLSFPSRRLTICGDTWIRTMIDGLTVRSNDLYTISPYLYSHPDSNRNLYRERVAT